MWVFIQDRLTGGEVMSVVVGYRVTAIHPTDRELERHDPPRRWGPDYLWQSSQSNWLNPAGVGGPGATATKIWKNEKVAKAQATVARNLGFDVDFQPVYLEDPRTAMLEAEVERLKVELGQERIYSARLAKELGDANYELAQRGWGH
jgi:hypothetical protein